MDGGENESVVNFIEMNKQSFNSWIHPKDKSKSRFDNQTDTVGATANVL